MKTLNIIVSPLAVGNGEWQKIVQCTKKLLTKLNIILYLSTIEIFIIGAAQNKGPAPNPREEMSWSTTKLPSR